MTRGSQFCTPTNPPKKDTIYCWDLGEGVAGFDLAWKGRAGEGRDYHEVDDDDDNNCKGGKHGKVINDSISEHKCILFSNIIYSITIYHTIK